jgi:hypothetical protein
MCIYLGGFSRTYTNLSLIRASAAHDHWPHIAKKGNRDNIEILSSNSQKYLVYKVSHMPIA